ncbi:barnase inhibitor [Kitasatospora sp. MMS16-BH015]|uniref:barstar family protein n=1 Tax=Kitasatospora sp. MMS16-BH015 TaxID=2018025 RepID=UPI000CA2C15D|nr:barstar family protein [Kitasatospora sp. MMS16-BH015]AUG80851.1 barnase inhibitor [Kitasatospora sp. MMS16-BH015]
MAAFDPTAPDLAYRLLRTSPVTLYHRPDLFAAAIAQLRADGYQVVELQAAAWQSEADLHREFAAALDFPAYYGRNLDALNDCLRDVLAFDYGASPEATGLVFAFHGYDHFTTTSPAAAHTLLDLLTAHSRTAALTGHRLLTLTQSDAPDLPLPPLGAVQPQWNDTEWLDAARRGD